MKTDLLSKKNTFFEVTPSVFSLALPTMLDELLGTAVQYIDTFMVSSMGMLATAAVGSTSTVNWLVGSTTNAFSIGFLSYISKKLGAEDPESAKRASAQSVLVTLFTGILFTVLTLSLSGRIPIWMHTDAQVYDLARRYFFIIYSPMLFRAAQIIFGTILRAAGDAKTPMRVGILVNLIDVVLNFLLIYDTRSCLVFGLALRIPGAGWGVVGAAVATAVSYVFGGVAITLSFLRHKVISPLGFSLRPDGKILRPCIRIAIPNMLQRFCTSLGYVFFAGMINSLGAAATAAHTIANTVESAFYIPGYGMQTAAATLTGNAIGAGDSYRRKNVASTILVLEVGMMILTGGLLFLFAPQMMSLFSKDASVILLGSTVLKMVALSEPFYGISIVTEGMLMGAGKTLAPFFFSAGTMWLVRILGTYICIHGFGLGLVSAWGCMIANNMSLLVCLRIYTRHCSWDT